MSKSMETNTAAIYLRKSTEDDGKSVAQQERELRTKADQLGVNVVSVYREDGDSFSCPSYSYHEHWNTGDRNVLKYIVQDAPTHAYNRRMAFQSGDSETIDLLHR